MDLKDLLGRLKDLESRQLLNPSEAISTFGFEKVRQVLVLMAEAESYNIPDTHFLTLLNEIRKPVKPSPVNQEISLPTLPLFEKNTPTETASYFISSEVLEVLSNLSKDSEIKLSTRDIAILGGCDPNHSGTAKKISQLLEPHFDFELATDPTRPVRTRTKVFSINLSHPVDYSELNSFLSSRSEKKTNFPIIISDYLHAEHSGYLFENQSNFDLSVCTSLVSKFSSRFKKNTSVALGYESGDTYVVEDTPIMRYLLDRALKQSFPLVELCDLVDILALPTMSVEHRKEVCSLVRNVFSQIQVSSDGGQTFSKLDYHLSGYSYLIAHSIISSVVADGGLPQPF